MWLGGYSNSESKSPAARLKEASGIVSLYDNVSVPDWNYMYCMLQWHLCVSLIKIYVLLIFVFLKAQICNSKQSLTV